jgi:hypothetical protein
MKFSVFLDNEVIMCTKAKSPFVDMYCTRG